MNIRERKSRLIRENLQKNKNAVVGMKIAGICILAIIAARLVFLLYELIYFSSSDIKISVVFELLVLPMLLVLYMVYDGNRALSSVTLISAVVRIIYHFSSVYTTLPKTAAADAYTVIFLAVMASQFILSIILTSSKKCNEYFRIRQKVNMQIRSEMLK